MNLVSRALFHFHTPQPKRGRIARDWNVKASGAGFVTRFEVDGESLSRFDEQFVGGRSHAEYWIPAERLEEFNQHIVGLIQVVAEFRA